MMLLVTDYVRHEEHHLIDSPFIRRSHPRLRLALGLLTSHAPFEREYMPPL
jgi:hypothetical protein